ncbi:MAG: HEAT repeat domain-containing protein [Deltaproteobacteria bacterium]|nr:HEAT repeat domain-containing protein [Deltaproteobacteria bacterium]
MKVNKKIMDYLDPVPTSEELQAVKDMMSSFLIGLKNYSLYPENHEICQTSVANAAMRLGCFLKSYNNLRLDIAKDRLFYKTEVVFQESESSEKLATVLFRDGIQWLQFLEGFGFNELKDFFGILKAYTKWQEDADGDLVTAFWEADFPNFRYKAVDVYWETEQLLDYSLLDTGGAQNSASVEQEKQRQSSLAVAMEDPEDSLWELTSEDAEKLRKMIFEEEKRDNLNDLLFVVFALFKDQTENSDLKFALQFLEGGLREALEQGDFQFAFRLVSGLRRIQRGSKNQKVWAMGYLDQFFLEISSPKVLNVVPEDFRSLDMLDSENLKQLSQFFLLLHPNSILVLGPLFSKTQSLKIQHQILQIIGSMAAKDIRPFEQLLKSPDEIMVQKLVPVLGQLKGEKPIQILLKMLRHSSDGVRNQVVKQLVTLNAEIIKEIFSLVEDPNDSIRNLVLRKLGKIRNETSEDLLMNYLEKRQFAITKHQHLLACYRALGRCGSNRSVPFLRKSLFKRGWFPDFRSIHRRGATVALIALGTKEAQEILKNASKSYFPTVRLAYRKALEFSQ